MVNHNHLLDRMPGVDGLKTGFTNASGFNIAISGVRDNRRLIVVVLGGPTRLTRDRTAESLLTPAST
jgi:D-alanyl-D-alanine carboxypeptidase (penicillin-binding protein 5/6)